MKLVKISLLLISIFIILVLSLSSCSRAGDFKLSRPASQSAETANGPRENEQVAKPQQVSLKEADQSQTMAQAMDRKIIKDANLTIEVATPTEAQHQITTMAESLGGFVVTSESKVQDIGDGKQDVQVNLVVRVPATQFNTALDQIRSLGRGVIPEKITGNDVTEEFIDLEARIKTQKALESQFLEIMKQATKVGDALEVQRQIADVRTEIEKLEGRKRFLENRAGLSTITVSLQSPTAFAVTTSSFGRGIREAVVDSVDVATGIVLFFIRFVIVMVPIFVFIILPGWFLARYFVRKARKISFAQQPATVSGSERE